MSARRLRREDGFVLPGAMSLLVIFLVLTATATALSLNSLSNTNRDRQVVRALQAADAGVDVAIFRLNHLLVAGSAGLVLGPIPDVAAAAGCTTVNAGVFTVEPVDNSSPYCPTQAGATGDVKGASYSYRMSNTVSVVSGVDNLLVRKIVSTGTSGGVQRRVLVKVRLVVGGAGSLALYQRIRHTECTSQPTTAVVDSGCPGADLN